MYKKNEHEFVNAGFKIEHGFAGGFMTEQCKEWTVSQLDRIVEESPDKMQNLYNPSEFLGFIKRLWQYICIMFGYDVEDNSLTGVLKRFGVPVKLADEMSNKIENMTETDIARWADFLKTFNDNSPKHNNK
jgi:hypothetical protein